MATKLYVGDSLTALKKMLLKSYSHKQDTVVSAVIIMDKMSGRSKGFGFIEMSTDEEAQKLFLCFKIKNLKDVNLLSTKLVQWKLVLHDNQVGGYGGNGGGGYGGGSHGGGRREY